MGCGVQLRPAAVPSPVDCLGGGQEDNGQAGTSPPAKEGGAQTGIRLPCRPATSGRADILDDDGPGLHGQASFYGKGLPGRKTTGERFDVKQFTAASNHFHGTQVAVRRVDNDRCAIVKVNDRMRAGHRRRVIDVSLYRRISRHVAGRWSSCALRR